MTGDRPLLRLSGLDVDFGTTSAVRGVNLAVYPGQTVALVGESGSGKSTTAHAVIDLLPGTGRVTGGSIEFDGTELTTASKRAIVGIRGTGIGLVPQDPMTNLNPVWKVGFQIRETLTANGIATGKAARERAVELLAEAGLPDAARRAGQYPHEFSGGMRQRALIAMALACRPKLLIADEPTSALDVTVQRQLLDHLDRLTGELGTAVLLITHDLGLAAERAEHVAVMYRGRVVESGPAQRILREPQHPYTRRLVAAAPALASGRGAVRRERAAVLAGADSAEPPDHVVVAEHLVKTFPLRGRVPWRSEPLHAVNDVSFRVARGTTTAVVGESGSGKSTLARLVLGLLAPTSGSVTFDGRPVTGLDRAAELDFRRRVQPVFQNPYGSLDPLFTIARAIEEPLRTHRVGTPAERAERVRDLVERVALPADVLRRYPHELSGGQRQRVAIARALALSPELVVCDEAVSALDVLVQAQILELLDELQAELGLSYLFISHDLAVVRRIADHVLVMRDGRVVEEASAAEVFENPREEYTRALLDAIPGRELRVG
ncbi:ABC transporter ATP-binding protein [Nocardia jiangsuensis]|uniref:ABC transporter ATP-binding protein n=1 Tax=Nocardia jiangsuensis TaxID=1691563 RepID=A0ABV8DVV1_9NOCA